LRAGKAACSLEKGEKIVHEPNATLDQAENLLRAGKIEAAVKLFRGVLDKDRKSVQALCGLARASLFLGMVGEAETCVEAAHKVDPGHGEVYAISGLIREAKGDMEGALEYHKRAVELAPGSFMTQYNYGRALGAARQHRQAIPHLRRAVEIDPESYDALYALGIVLKESGEIGKAVGVFTKAMKLAPDNPDIYATLSDVLVEARDLPMAREVLEEGLRRHPRNPALLGKASAVAMGAGDMPAAVAYLERQVEAAPGYEQAWINLANLSMLTNDLEKSEWAANEVLKRNPGNWQAHYHLGNLYEATRLYAEAEKAYRRAVELAPKEHKPLGNLGALLIEMDDPNKNREAVHILECADKLAPEGEWRLRYNLALAHAKLGEKEKALKVLAIIRKNAPPENEAFALAGVLEANLTGS